MHKHHRRRLRSGTSALFAVFLLGVLHIRLHFLQFLQNGWGTSGLSGTDETSPVLRALRYSLSREKTIVTQYNDSESMSNIDISFRKSNLSHSKEIEDERLNMEEEKSKTSFDVLLKKDRTDALIQKVIVQDREQHAQNRMNEAMAKHTNTTIPFSILAAGCGSNFTFPIGFDDDEAVMDILSTDAFDTSTLRPLLNISIETETLGILIDAGRHYFHISWLKRLMDVMYTLQFNYIHFRLTDDQAFAIELISQPNLTHPTRFQRNTKVYTKANIRELLAYARQKGISIIPEINVPGHCGAWTGIPDMVVPCKNYACNTGGNIPLNILHPRMYDVLSDVIQEVIEIFEDPPYLHLGGDEIELSTPCFSEVKQEIFNYTSFEQMLKRILSNIDYPEKRVIRWRETSFTRNRSPKTTDSNSEPKTRAGHITHWWHDNPGETKNVSINSPILGSSGLYMDVNKDDTAWEVFLNSRKWLHMDHLFPQMEPINLKGVVVGAFELNEEFFHHRNVVGRMLAVTIGVSAMPIENCNELYSQYMTLCYDAGFPKALCERYGKPISSWKIFHRSWTMMWYAFKKDLCYRFPELPELN